MMIKAGLTFILIVFSLTISAQNETEKELLTIENTELAEKFISTKSTHKNQLIVFNEEMHKSVLAKELFKLSKGVVKTSINDNEKVYYKIVEKNFIPYYRVSYIFFDGNQIKPSEINSVREKIIKSYKSGTDFDFLAKQYSMDKNATRGGDSGWFKEGDSKYAFEKFIITDNHDIDDIFTIDTPSNNGYYVILKTFEPKNIAEIKVLKITEPNN
ncbi:MAG: peptidyl-prolyl cis-trans isomerase [Flavobacteriaceae bacterium]|nr:peptidyl-prolyl cis-trans isomerase [Flavobacteriaceae bacterium]